MVVSQFSLCLKRAVRIFPSDISEAIHDVRFGLQEEGCPRIRLPQNIQWWFLISCLPERGHQETFTGIYLDALMILALAPQGEHTPEGHHLKS